jgi:hypothetical protein
MHLGILNNIAELSYVFDDHMISLYIFAHRGISNNIVVRTRTRHRVPPTLSTIRRTHRRRRLAGSAIRRTIRRALLKTRNPTRPGETPSGRTAVMGFPRSVRPPLGLRRSKLSNTKNTDERWAENKGEREKIEVCRFVFTIACCCSIGRHPSCI